MFVGKFAQPTNMTKVELITDPQVYFEYQTLDEVNDLNARFLSDKMIKIRNKNNKKFIASNAKTNVVIFAFTTAYARLKLCDVPDMMQERVPYCVTDSIIFVSKPNDPEPIEIINNTRGGIVIFFTENKRERVFWGANSSPGCRARRLLAELMLP